MENYSIVLFLLAMMIILSSVADKSKLPYPMLLVGAGIAIGLPETLSDGSPFPQRNIIIFISVVVVLFTLVGQGLSLPWLVKKLTPGTKK